MSFFSNIVSNFKEFYSEINGATLTGAIDVIVVEQEDGTFKSFPFHVRFGKLGVMKAREKIVDLEINGEPVEMQMKLDDSGVAFFVEDVEKDEESHTVETEITISDVEEMKKDDNILWDDISLLEEISVQKLERNDDMPNLVKNTTKEKSRKMRKPRLSMGEIFSRRSLTEAFLNIDTLPDDMFDMDDITSQDQDYEDAESFSELCNAMSPLCPEEGTAALLKEMKLEPIQPDLDRASSGGDSGYSDSPFSFPQEFEIHKSSLHPIYLNNIKTEPVDPIDISYNEDNNKVKENYKTDQESSIILPLEPVAKTHRIMRIDSGCEADLDSPPHKPDLPEHLSSLLPDLAGSLCGGLTGASISPKQFAADLLTFPQFVQQLQAGAGNAVTHPNLVIRMHEKYLSWEQAAPILLIALLFGQPLPDDTVREIIKDTLDVNINISSEELHTIIKQEDLFEAASMQSSWLEWFARTPKQEMNERKSDLTHGRYRLDTESSTTSGQDSACVGVKRKVCKSLRLSSGMIATMNLKPGHNEIQFSVTTAFQGTSRCSCSIYLWRHTDKVVISDIDGTITKSDVLGHILPAIGHDWAQSGVAQLFSKIRNNGYHIMYLSARAIGQATNTKDYLHSVKQGDVHLPDGPLFLNPDSLIHAFKREVIDRNPEEFKISCLKEIQSLFGEKNPFFAGYGNRPNDAFSYQSVGIPTFRIFTINPAGVLRHKLTNTFQTSYPEQNSVADFVFPPVDGCETDPDLHSQEFSSFGFWREDLPIVVGPLEVK